MERQRALGNELVDLDDDFFPATDLVWLGRDGQPVSFRMVMILFEDHEYRQLAYDEITEGIWVSTVWLPSPNEEMRIFETMMRINGDCSSVRWRTESEALRGHDALLDELRGALDA